MRVRAGKWTVTLGTWSKFIGCLIVWRKSDSADADDILMRAFFNVTEKVHYMKTFPLLPKSLRIRFGADR